MSEFKNLPVWKELQKQSEIIKRPENHLKKLLDNETRLEDFSLKIPGVFFDFSKQRINKKIMAQLIELAEARNLRQKFVAMVSGKKVNSTENRAALHTATRDFSSNQIMVNGKNIIPEITEVRSSIKEFAKKVHNREITGSTGKSFEHVVVIGIGGSYLGTEFVARALQAYASKHIKLHFLANVDSHNFGEIIAAIEPEKTLWIIISKSYTTAETMANVGLAIEYMKDKVPVPEKHLITVTSKGSPGDNQGNSDNPVLSSFHMFDYIGGRYSVTSAVGGVPLSLLLGYDIFDRFLGGAAEMDLHASSAPARENLPMVAALISVWNFNFLGYKTQAVIPYASPLSKLAPHVQQLNMESNGKSSTVDGKMLDEPVGIKLFGEPGTNAQHSFFQLAHQGQPFPIDFIGVIKPQYEFNKISLKGVTNHQELWANLIAQPAALAYGKDDPDPARRFSGNRPSSTIVLDNLSPESVGRILSFYEAKTVYEAFIWGINPFDQFGVELGKILASDIRENMAEKNRNNTYEFDKTDSVTRFYLKMIS